MNRNESLDFVRLALRGASAIFEATGRTDYSIALHVADNLVGYIHATGLVTVVSAIAKSLFQKAREQFSRWRKH